MNQEQQGTMVRRGNIIRIDNALVEETSCPEDAGGSIVISYTASGPDQMTQSVENVRLNLSERTVILNSDGQELCACCIQTGSRVDVVFSARMTRSIPPQSNAYLVIVRREPGQDLAVTTGRIAYYDEATHSLYTGSPGNVNTQKRFILTDDTPIINRMGRPVGVQALRPGRVVRIAHENFMTASIPPQTRARSIQIIW